MFGCYRRGDANDPDTYVAAIAAMLATYPEDVIQTVTNPTTGLPRKSPFLPSVSEVAAACDAEMKAEIEEVRRARAIEKQFAERRQFEEERKGPKPTYNELVARCARDGLYIGGHSHALPLTPEEACEALGIDKAEFDAIPDARK